MVFQFGALFDSMTVGENIGLALQKLTNCDKLEFVLKEYPLLVINLVVEQDKKAQ